MPYDLAPFRAHLAPSSAEETVKQYVTCARAFLAVIDGDPGAIHAGSLKEFVTHMHGRGLAPATMYQRVAGARAFVDYLRETGQAIPALAEPDMPTVKAVAPPSLTMDDMRRVKAWAWQHIPQPVAAAIVFLAITGCRVDELCSLRRTQLQWERDDAGELWYFLEAVRGKGKSDRNVYIVPADNGTVRDYIMTVRRSLPHYDAADPWLFPAGGGLPIRKRTVQNATRRVKDGLNMARLTPHHFRHHWATRAHAAGVDVETIRKHLGHASITTTMRYLHVSPETMRAGLRKVGA